MSEVQRAAFLNNTSGFNYRKITGTDKLSTHSFGRAIDINPVLFRMIFGFRKEQNMIPVFPAPLLPEKN